MFDEKFWLAIVFITFVATILKLFLPKINHDLQLKINEIDKEINDTKNRLEIAKNELKNTQEKILLTEKENVKLIQEAQILAKNIIEQAKINANNDYDKKLNNAIARLEQEQQQVLNQLKKEIIIDAFKDIESYLKFNLNNQQKQQILNADLEQLNKL